MADDNAVLLKIDKISKSYGNTRAVRNLSLEIRRGEIFTLLGPSGCGKSTTLRMIAGLENPESGTISLTGTKIADAVNRKFTPPEKRNMGMVFQAFAVWPHMTVFDNIAFPLRIRRESRSSIRKKAMDALELVGLAARAQEYPWQLSGGMQQRVALARAIVYSPDLLLLDEPLSNLDAKLREQMRDELRNIQRKLGATFVFVTHDQHEAMALSTRIAVMNSGTVEHIGTPAEVYEAPATAFVRDFLGKTVLFTGTVRSENNVNSVELDVGGRVPIHENCAACSAGARVTLACRAESIRLLDAGAVRDDCIAALIEDATYIGERVDYSMKVGDMHFTVCCHDDDRHAVGTQVALGFSRKGMSVWPNGD